MQKAYFTEIRNQIIPILEEAKQDITIAMAWFTSNELFSSLLNCLSRGVHVELVLLDNAINFMDYAPDFNLFIKAGGVLHIAESNIGFMHHKFCVVDDAVVITGSYNWTYYAETRNVENILISDNASVVLQFKAEFRRLTAQIAKASSSPRLTWSEIEELSGVDFGELNYEIEHICEARNQPIKKVFKTQTKVTRIEIQLKPYAKYDVGIFALDKKGRKSFYPFIHAGNPLPCKSQLAEFFFDSENEKAFPCQILYDKQNGTDRWQTIKVEDLMQLAQGTSNVNLPIALSMSLDDNGCLRIDASCEKSGQRLNISSLNQDLVKYE